jgi:Porin subfamily
MDTRAFLLGCVAGLAVVAGAQAAELPVKAKPVEYVRVCSLYGAGFLYIPGTQACMKIGGFVRAEIKYDAIGSFEPAINGANAQFFRAGDRIDTRARAGISLDAREQTAYDTLRAYLLGGWQYTSNDARPSAFPARQYPGPAERPDCRTATTTFTLHAPSSSTPASPPARPSLLSISSTPPATACRPISPIKTSAASASTHSPTLPNSATASPRASVWMTGRSMRGRSRTSMRCRLPE